MQQEYITSRKMRALEINAEYFGISLLQLMENAGRNIAAEINSRFKKDQRIVIFCGLGGNGGDGFVAARHLLSMGFSRVAVVLDGKGKDIAHEAALANWVALQRFGESIPIKEITDVSDLPAVEVDVLVDALLGTGTKGKLKPPISGFVEYINSVKAFKIAVDVPTGIDSDTGDVLGNAVKADVTVTFHKPKKGLEVAKKFVGELIVRDIGLPLELESFAGPGDVLLVTKMRTLAAHKGDFGKALFIGGSEVFSGAPALMSMAALRTGVDIAYTAAPEETAHDIASMSPDLISIKLQGSHLKSDNVAALKEYLPFVDVVVLGPGAGLHAETKDFMKLCIEAVEAAKKPLLLDADGLKAFAEFKRQLKVPFVLTPHAGEYAILTGRKLPEDLDERIQEVKRTAAKLGAVILLKGQIDIISNGKRVKLNFTGNPGMTVGGTGDVLSGVVGALIAQKADPFEAAVAGAFVNGAAGDFIVDKLGYHMVATDLLDFIPQVLNDPTSHLKVQKTRGKTP
jgi:ADP-dependent NAD(P)H-hydrate dehydratase / NAD(P)H-hydrate epimerase